MTNKELFKLLDEIRDYCRNQSCSKCKFRITIDKEKQCQFKVLATELSQLPCHWNIYSAREIISK